MAGSFLVIFLGSLCSLVFNQFFIFNFGKERTYTEGVVGEIVHLNPVFTEYSDADADISSLIFSGLVRYNAVTGTFEEDLATHTLSEDHLVYTFTLKNGVVWQDGEPVTAEDVYYTYVEVIQAPEFENTLLKSNFDGVKIEAPNSRTITFTLNSPNSFFYTALTVGILPKHILGEVPVVELATHDFNKTPVGSGPYKVNGSYEINNDGTTSVNLMASENYYGIKPQIENLRFVAYPTITDLIENRSSWHGAARIRESMLEEMDLTDLVSYEYELPMYTALFLNTDSLYLDENKERLGLSKAINKEDILATIAYTHQIDTPLLELDQATWLHIWDQKEAQGALFDAGWSLNEGESVRTNGDGDPYTIRLIRRDFTGTNEPQEETVRLTAETIQAQLKEVGIEVSIEAYSAEELNEKIKARDYDMLLYGQSLGYNLDTFAYWHSSQATESGFNLSNYQNPAADLLIEKIRGTFDTSERESLLEKLAQTISEDVPAVFLYTPSNYYLVDAKMKNVKFTKILLPKDRFSNIIEWEFN